MAGVDTDKNVHPLICDTDGYLQVKLAGYGFPRGCKYAVVLDGSTYAALNGKTGKADSENASAHTVIQYAIDTGGAGVVAVLDNIALTSGITGKADVTLDLQGIQ